MTKSPEILAPVGNFESLRAAVYNGADAVYLGVDAFNARGNVQNFSRQQLPEAVKFAHFFGVKVYMTINILVFDSEMSDAVELVGFAAKSGVDAFIVQDIGLASALRTTFPNIELHASTQMGINNLEGVRALAALGFSRVVLARETPLAEIKRIHENCDIEIEYFVQGALCVAFSGNCYLCSALANASGNRGQCKQFCRLQYTMSDGKNQKNGYLLSTKDFCMLPSLKMLAECGVTSFKIEGRARRAAYVAQATAAYRKCVDNNFEFTQSDIDELKKVYNRGDYIEGYFKNQKIIYPFAQNHIGIKIGSVLAVKKGKRFNEVTIQSSHCLCRGDSIKLFCDNKEVAVISIYDVHMIKQGIYKITTTAQVSCDAEVRLIVDSKQESELLSQKSRREVSMTLDLFATKPAVLHLQSGSISVSVQGAILEKAANCPLSESDAKRQLSKTGEFFVLSDFKLNTDGVFMPISALNQLRRDGLEMLAQAICNDYDSRNKIKEKAVRADNQVEPFNAPFCFSQMILFSDVASLPKDMPDDSILVYQPSEFDYEKLAGDFNKLGGRQVYLSLPAMAGEGEVKKIKEVLSIGYGVYANNYYALELLPRQKTIIGSNMNVTNSFAVLHYSNQGFKDIVLSIENFDIDHIQSCGARLFALCDYRPEYMIFRHCPVKEHIGGNCDSCKWNENIKYFLNKKTFYLVRRRINTCQFLLKSDEKITRNLPKNICSAIEL